MTVNRELGLSLKKYGDLKIKKDKGYTQFRIYSPESQKPIFLEIYERQSTDTEPAMLFITEIEVPTELRGRGLSNSIISDIVEYSRFKSYASVRVHHPWNTEFWSYMVKKYPEIELGL